jgi:multidrug efflux pump subunit AcrA (membrane-fusion protein)
MKPIIIDMKEMSESTEVYHSTPTPFLVYSIYLVLGIVVIALIWAYFFKLDIVVKSNGLFRYEEETVDVSSSITGKVENCDIQEGQYVNEGDVLLTVSVDSIGESVRIYQETLDDIEQRIEILTVYQNLLDGDENALKALEDNKYYEEFCNRKNLLDANIAVSDNNISGQIQQYQKNADNIRDSISRYEEQLEKLKNVEECIKTRENTFSASDSYYYSMINSYISSYNSTVSQYDVQIAAYEDSLAAAQKVNEKNQALDSMEVQQIASVEQLIESANSSILSLQSSLSTAEAQLECLAIENTTLNADISIMTEKSSIAAELITYESKKTECENNLNSLNIQDGKCVVTADKSGYISMNSELKKGSYIQEGTVICQILPQEDNDFYAEIYVENGDIAKIKENQQVKFEIAAYPSSEYGYFSGVIDTISKDIKADSSGSAYYLVKVRCDKTTVVNKNGDTGTVKNGMACQAKVVIDEQSVLRYLLEKIDLIND